MPTCSRRSSGRLSGPAAKAIAAALALDANHAKALWLKASLALEERRYPDAVQDWRRLRAVVADESSDARIIDANIAEALALAGTAPATQTASAIPSSGAPAIAIRGTVEVDPSLQARVKPGMTLFVFARAAEGSGPPLAVLRTQPTSWPVAFQLDDSLAMLPSRRLSAFDHVIVEARLSTSGQALAQSGDLQIASGVISHQRPAEVDAAHLQDHFMNPERTVSRPRCSTAAAFTSARRARCRFRPASSREG